MSKNKSNELKPIQIICEGREDERFLRALITKNFQNASINWGINFPTHPDGFGKDAIPAFLKTIAENKKFEEIKIIVIVLDMDNEVGKNFTELKYKIEKDEDLNQNFSLPDKTFSFPINSKINQKPIYIITIPKETEGCLETILLKVALEKWNKENELKAFIGESFDNFKENVKDKKFLRILIEKNTNTYQALGNHWEESMGKDKFLDLSNKEFGFLINAFSEVRDYVINKNN